LEKNAQNCPENDSISRKSSNTEFTMYNVVMATLAKQKRTKASIMVFSSISKRSEHVRQLENLFRSEVNMFILKNLKIEAKRTRSVVRKFISKRSEHVYVKELKNRSEAKVLY